jgi:ABC-type multidrug transport system permease subunit
MITPSIKHNLIILWYFFRRDICAHTKQLYKQLIDFSLIYPVQYAICFAYLQARLFFGTQNIKQVTVFFAGSILVIILVFTFRLTVDLLFDLQNERFIDYQITMLSPRLVLLERIVFASLYTFILTVPFYPVAKIVLRNHIETSHASWLHLWIILFAGALCLSAYHQCATLILKRGEQLSSLWARVNFVLITFGGFWVPLHAMHDYSPLFAYFMQLNPALYVSEGLRQALVGGPEFLSFWHCLIALLLFSGVFIVASWYLFKKRVDHI